MKSFRKIIALALVIALIANPVTYTYAFGGTKADVIASLKLMQGNNGDMMLEKELARDQAVKIIITLIGKASEAEVMTKEEISSTLKDFSDAKQLTTSWSAPWYAYAVKNGIISGYKDKQGNLITDYAGKLYGKQFATMLLKALGYQNVNYETSVYDLSRIEGSSVPVMYAEQLLTRGMAIEYLYGALTAKNSLGTRAVEHYVGNNAELTKAAQNAGLIAQEAFGVSKITADNLKSLKVTFNKPINTTAITAENLIVSANGVTIAGTPIVSDDKLSISYIYTSSIDQSSTATVTLNGIVSITGEIISTYTSAFIINDITPPQALNAVVHNPKQIEVFFNEPINYKVNAFQILNNIKIDNIPIIATAEPNNTKNSVIFTMTSAMKPGQHKITITDMIDYATYKAVFAEFTIDVQEDKVAPYIISAEVQNINTIIVNFNEKLEAIGIIKVNGSELTHATPVKDDTTGTKFALTGFPALNLSALVEIKITYLQQFDGSGNAVLAEKNYMFKANDDTSIPTASVSVEEDNIIKVTFSKSMNYSLGSITIKNSEGKVVGSPFTASPTTTFASQGFIIENDGTVLRIPLTCSGLYNVNEGNYTLEIKDMKDATIRENLMPQTTIQFKTRDTQKPIISSGFLVTPGTTSNPADNDTVTFYFSEAMDVVSLRNLSNYIYSYTSGTAVSYSLAAQPGAEVISIAQDAKSITIRVPGISITPSTGVFTVYGIKDQAGNIMTSAINSVTRLNQSQMSFTVTGSAVAQDEYNIKVNFNNKAAVVDPSGFKVIKNGADYAVITAVKLSDDGNSAILTTNLALGTSTAALNLVPNVGYLSVKNIYGVSITYGALAISDQIKPNVNVQTDNVMFGAVSLSFSEQVGASAVTDILSDLIVKDKNGDIVKLTYDKLIFYNGTTLSNALLFDRIVVSGLTSNSSYSVSLLNRTIKDMSGNVMNELKATTVVAK